MGVAHKLSTGAPRAPPSLFHPPCPTHLKYETAMGVAHKLSTGVLGPKKPWICPQCKSTQHTRSMPMA
jgi:hypothetical protein